MTTQRAIDICKALDIPVYLNFDRYSMSVSTYRTRNTVLKILPPIKVSK
jgi:hypothetical protein